MVFHDSSALGAARLTAPARLVVTLGENEGMMFPLSEALVSIGRGPENSIQIIDGRMSRRHTLLLLNEGQWFARDLGSKNGTQLNGMTIQGDRLLAPGDSLQVGETVLTFEQEISAQQRSSRTSTGVRVVSDDGMVVPSKVVKVQEEASEGAEVPLGDSSSDAERLAVLYRVGELMRSLLDLDQLLEQVLDLTQQLLQPDRAGVLIYDERYHVLIPQVIRRPPDTDEDIVISSTIINRAVEDHVAVLVTDAPHDLRFSAADSIVIQRIHSAICAPLIHKDQVLGVIYLDRRSSTQNYQERDLHLIAGIANQAALAITNSRLHRRLLEQHARERELEIARTIQQDLLPRVMPDLPGYEVSGLSVAAHMVGGDYYDVFTLSDGRCVLAIADVSGKGVPAAILTATVRAAAQVEMRSLAGDNLVEIVSRLNQMVCRDTAGNLFVTMFLAVLDPLSRTLTYCNAGHVHPLLRHSDGRLEPLETGGCFLGVIPGFDFEQGAVVLPHDSHLVMFSDGVTDTMNEKNEMFGQERLVDVLAGAGGQSAAELCQALEEKSQVFRNSAEPFDDLTLLVLRTLP